MSGKIDLVISELSKIGKVIDSLAVTQDSLADSLRLELRSLNMTFTGNIASTVFGEESSSALMSMITTAARIPGVCTLLVEESEGAASGEILSKLSDLIAEDVKCITATDDTPQFISGVLDGIASPENIVCENEESSVRIMTNEKDVRLYNRLKLAEQFMPYEIGG